MELKYFFLIISLIYFLFDFLNKAKTKNQTPPIPEQQPEPVLQDIPKKNPLPALKQKAAVAGTVKDPAPAAASAKAKPQSIPQSVQKESGWEDKLQPSLVLNGVIFAEILQPPRAMRPMETRFGRRR